MSGENFSRVSSSEFFADASAAKQRRKRKWDQPAESLVAAGVAVPGILPSRNMGSLAAITLPGVTKASGAPLTSPFLSSSAATLPLIQPHATIILQNINQKKIPDELIAREIVINDADSAVRYMLTKRQTQEEIQKCTGTIVITRGKYHPPNAPSDGEKPLYLHISAGAHLETTVERIKAVDRAAAMVEELLKQGSVNNGGKAINLLSTCVYLGFETDPSLNVAARIRGPNDQYVNHIMNETGATVLLRGRGSGYFESGFGEEGQQPLHLFLSSNNPISLESAKRLADNLLDTISIEFGASRKVYGMVQLIGFQGSGSEMKANNSSAVGLISSTANSAAIPPGSSATHPDINTAVLPGTTSVSMGSNSVHLQPNTVSYPRPSLATETSYSGYGGIYPQATPLQQVASVLRQSPSIINPIVAPASTEANSNETLTSENRASQKRKFQESPAALKGHPNPHQNHGLFSQNSSQGSEFVKPGVPTSYTGVRNLSTMPAPKKLARPSFDRMPPPPPRTMPLPRPLKFNSTAPASKVPQTDVLNKSILESSISDTLIKLMEYGEEDDDPDEITEESYKTNSHVSSSKPFWAV